jgi:lambda family phage portal protein
VLNPFDSIIRLVNPEAALRRARARLALDVLSDHAKRRYEGATKSRRTSGWKAESSSANAETSGALTTLRDRHRDLVRNNPWARRAVTCIVTNTVGYGIEPAILSRSKARIRRLEDIWRRWAGSVQCDAEGRKNMAGIQAQVMRTVAESGEALVVRRRRGSGAGLAVPIQLQVFEPDQIDSLKNGPTEDGGRIVQGVEYDSTGRTVAYWLYTSHPGDGHTLRTRAEVKRFLAEDVAHIFVPERPGQARGVPWGAAVMLRLRDLDDYEDAYLLRQKLANCFTAFVEDSDITPSVGSSSVVTESLEPGAIEILPSGKKVTFSDPPKADDYGKFTADQLYAVAACYGITFEALTGNLVNVSFTSGRMGWLEMQRNIEFWRWQMLIPQGLDRIAEWFLDGARLMGESVDDVRFTWTPPRRELIDPTKEISAMRSAVRAGITSLKEVHRELGVSTEQVMNEIAEVNKMADELGITLDSDPRKTSNAGLTQARPPGSVIPGEQSDEAET